MLISKVFKELEAIRAVYGDIEVYLQNEPADGSPVIAHDNFFIVPEDYEEEGTVCNIRTWPY